MSYKNRSPRVNKRGNVEFRKFCISRSFLGLQETLSRFPRPPHSDRRKGENVNFSSFRPSDCDVFIFIRSIRFGFVRPKDFLSALRWGLAGGRREGGTRKGGREEGRKGGVGVRYSCSSVELLKNEPNLPPSSGYVFNTT